MGEDDNGIECLRRRSSRTGRLPRELARPMPPVSAPLWLPDCCIYTETSISPIDALDKNFAQDLAKEGFVRHIRLRAELMCLTRECVQSWQVADMVESMVSPADIA